ncbi:MAG: hypothetical protein P0Y66_18870 [Candidatus Kaistia colombiensis]|nr:MAG: hypothetical protein P0Y66_18870 [Kaistia sp.]
MITEMKSILHIGAVAAILGISTIGVSAPALARGHHNIEDSGGHGGGHGGSVGPTMASAWSTGGMSGWSGGGHSGGSWWGGGSGGSWSGGHEDHDRDHHHHHHPGVVILHPGLFAGYNPSSSSYSNEAYGYDYAPCPYPHQYNYFGFVRNACVVP